MTVLSFLTSSSVNVVLCAETCVHTGGQQPHTAQYRDVCLIFFLSTEMPCCLVVLKYKI